MRILAHILLISWYLFILLILVIWLPLAFMAALILGVVVLLFDIANYGYIENYTKNNLLPFLTNMVFLPLILTGNERIIDWLWNI